uniref:Beta-glucosidase 12-like n=1 Tax=Ananas comosus var. bracteatus TaxID=296719 RepID=A0A6V7QUF6_ANACO
MRVYASLHLRFLEPLTRGKYPSSMQSLVGNRLPVFSKKQSELVKGSYDFIGVNYYTASYTYSVPPPPNNVNATFSTDAQINATGVDEYNNKTASLKEALNDRTRVSYYKKHLLYVRQAIR